MKGTGFGDSPVTHPLLEVGAWRVFGKEAATSPSPVIQVACEAIRDCSSSSSASLCVSIGAFPLLWFPSHWLMLIADDPLEGSRSTGVDQIPSGAAGHSPHVPPPGHSA